MVLPADNFPKLSLLPVELRRRIWQDCLPNRVIEFYFWWTEFAGTHCYLPSPRSSGFRFPAVTGVCHESRQVAFENGAPMSTPLDTSSLSQSIGYGALPQDKIWIGRDSSVACFTWDWDDLDYFQREGDINGPGPTAEIITFLQWVGKSAHEVVIPADKVLPFKPLARPRYECQYDRLEHRGSYLTYLEVIDIHLSLTRAATSNLFLKDQQATYVEVNDSEKLRAFRALHLSGLLHDTHSVDFLDLAVLDDFPTMVEEYKQEVEKL